MWQEIGRYHSEFITATQLREVTLIYPYSFGRYSDLKLAVIQIRSSYMLLLDPPDKKLVHKWLAGGSPFTPSWINLLNVMRISGLRELANASENFLYTVPATASLPVEGAGEGRGTGRGTQSREQGELRQGLWWPWSSFISCASVLSSHSFTASPCTSDPHTPFLLPSTSLIPLPLHHCFTGVQTEEDRGEGAVTQPHPLEAVSATGSV